MANFSKQDEVFLNKLDEIIEENMQDEQFGVSDLSHKLNISRSGLYTKVKKITGVSVSKYICNIRLYKAKELLLSTSKTISETAFEVGFHSTSYFIKCYHEFYGFPPGETHVKEQEDIANGLQDGSNVPLTITKLKHKGAIYPEQQGNLLTVKWVFVLALFFLLLVLIIPRIDSFLVLSKSTSLSENKSMTIAILPFKNLTSDKNNQYFADGMSEDIINNLSHIEQFKVISPTSTEQYRNSIKPLSRIGLELNADYLLEGSVQKDENSTKIHILLNDAKTNVVMWSATFNRELNDIFNLQSDISKQIVKVLKTVLTPEELELIERKSTENTQAYVLYMKGRYFEKKRTPEDLNRCLNYYNQSLKVDSNYSLAYAGLASAYMELAYYHLLPWNEGAVLGRKYAQKALSIDQNLSEVYVVLARIRIQYEDDYEGALKDLRLAIDQNPNNASAYFYSSIGLLQLGRLKEAVKYINKAIALEPNSAHNYNRKASWLYQLGEYEASLEAIRKGLEIDNNLLEFYYRRVKAFVWLKQDTNAINSIIELTNIIEPGYKPTELINRVYHANNLKGVVLWFIYWLDEKNLIHRRRYVYVADLYAAIEMQEKALDYLEKYIVLPEVDPVNLKYNIQFEKLHNIPRFTALFEQGNVIEMQ